MRRIDPNVREELLRCRAEAARATEVNELIEETCGENEARQKSLDDYFNAMVKYCAALVSSELSQIAHEFDFDPLDEWTAFPYDKGENDFNESAADYAAELVADLLEVYDIPALAVVDELENWLDLLWKFHLKNKEQSK